MTTGRYSLRGRTTSWWVRWASMWGAGLAAVGLAEQHHHPGQVLDPLPFVGTPVWVIGFTATAVVVFAAAVTYPAGHPAVQRTAAAVFAGALWLRAIGIGWGYGLDLWGTCVQVITTGLLTVGSWSWTNDLWAGVERERSGR